MNSFRYALLACASFVLSTSFIFGKHDEDMSNGYEKQDSHQDKSAMVGYNASCRKEVQRPYDFFISGGFTYWQPTQENMKLGVVSNSSAELDLVNGYEVDLGRDYKPGFQVLLGMNFDYDNWFNYLKYTWFRGTEKTQVALDPDSSTDSLLPAWQIPDFLNPQYDSGSESWTLNMDIVDWCLSRSYTVGKELCFSHFFGLRYALIRQKLNVSYVNTNVSNFFIWPSTYVEQTTRGWGIGPEVGLSTNWNLGSGFRIFSDGEFDILFTDYNLTSKQYSEIDEASIYLVKQNGSKTLRAHAELCIGMGWGSYFCNDNCHFDLSAEYGFQVFFDQNMFRSFAGTSAVGKSVAPNGNLYVQGLTVTCRFGF